MENYEKKNRIAQALQIRGMKQVDLCNKTGLSDSAISSWSKQRWQPKQKALFAMARALDVSELWLAGYDVPMERAPEQKKMDELAALVHQLRKNEELKEVCLSISNLSESQFSIVRAMVHELIGNK
jgi:transcriptional regulator with XRE-family HTH domain